MMMVACEATVFRLGFAFIRFLSARKLGQERKNGEEGT